MKTKWVTLLAVGLAIAGCKKAEDASSSGTADGYLPPPEQRYTTSTNETAPPPNPLGPNSPAPASNPPPAAALGATNAAGLPTSDGEGNVLNAIQGLQRVVDYYNRTLLPQSAPRAPGDRRKPLPPLTDLQQLVSMGLVKQLPQAPPGKKYVLEGGIVKTVNQ